MATKDIVLVTGSSGLIGSALTERLQQKYEVIGMDVEAPRSLPGGSQFLEVDLTEDDSVAKAMAQVRDRHGDAIASVVHLAAYYDFSGEESPLYEEITVRGTERLLREASLMKCEQFLFSSTLLVHQPCKPGERINEDWPLEPSWPYPESKIQTEDLIRSQHGSIPVVLLRIAGVYDDYCHSLPLSHQIQRIYERWMTSRVYPGDLDAGQALLHLEDLIHGIELAIEKRDRLPLETTLLLGEPETLSYGELQRELGRLIHEEEWETKKVPKPVAKAGAWVQEQNPFGEEPFIKPWMVDHTDDHYAIDVGRAQGLLGWGPSCSVREALPKMVEALKKDPVAWYKEHDLTGPKSLEERASSR